MWSLFTWLYHTAVNIAIDFGLYVLVDLVAKSPLQDTSDEEEKRKIWLYECLVLALVAALVYIVQRTPYTLLLLTCLTFLYTQLLGRVNFGYWWSQLSTNWDEFQQHEESMEKLQEMQIQAAQTPQVIQHPHPNRFVMHGHMPQPMPFDATHTNMGPPADSSPPWYPADAERWMPMVTVAVSEGSGGVPQYVRYRTPMAMMPPSTSYVPPPSAMYSRVPEYMMANHRSPPSPKYPVHMPRMTELARPSIHPHLQSPKQRHPSLSFKSKVMSVFGINPYTKVPPGLKNDGQNTCFLNSILQCLSHCPGLVQCLPYEVDPIRCNPSEAALLNCLSDIFAALLVQPGTSDIQVVDASPVRAAASHLPGSMVNHPEQGSDQIQQDAAEFLMWLLDALHNCLNVSRHHPRNQNGSSESEMDWHRQPGSPRFTGDTLNMLRFIYGDLSPQRITELKAVCREEIERANGLDNESYAEPIQRLSDLEWLTYKEQHNSAIDDLYTGQLVEAQHCIACNRISVSIQTFNILPVPIVQPRHFNGLVYLEDCFAKFSNIEELFGPDGLKCECSNKAMQQGGGGQKITPSTPTRPPTIPKDLLPNATTPPPTSPIMPNGGNSGGKGLANYHKKRLLGSDSAMQATLSSAAISPIPATGEVFNDSGFQDHLFKTSTPIGHPAAALPVRLTDGQKRSMLRQLPECLVVQLLRFSHRQGTPYKINRPVSIPLINLDLTQQIADNVMRRQDLTALNACFRYSLCGLCLHLGGEHTSYGHYVTYTHSPDGAWYKFDDEQVTPVNMEYELNTRQVRENAYLLFYKKGALV